MDRRATLRGLFGAVRSRYERLRNRGATDTDVGDDDDDLVTAVDRALTGVIVDQFDDIDGSFAFVSEETRKTPAPERGEEAADYTVLFDEVDGTLKMRAGVGSFGPVVAIAEGVEPRFEDVVAAGHLNFRDDEFYEAYRGEGTFRACPFDAAATRVETSGRERLDGDGMARLLLDQPMLGKVPEIAARAWRYACNDFGVQSRHYTWVADGTKDAFVTGGHGLMPNKPENTAEELAGGYLLVTEAGGSVVDWTGTAIGSQRVGLAASRNHDVVAAASPSLAGEVVDEIVPPHRETSNGPNDGA